MTLKFNDYALINGHPRGGGGGGGLNPPLGHMWAWSSGFVDICCQCLAQDGGLDCFCKIPEEKTPRVCYAPSRIGWERE